MKWPQKASEIEGPKQEERCLVHGPHSSSLASLATSSTVCLERRDLASKTFPGRIVYEACSLFAYLVEIENSKSRSNSSLPTML